MPTTLRSRPRDRTTRGTKTAPLKASAFFQQKPHATNHEAARRLNIPTQEALVERAKHVERFARWESKIRRMLEERPHPTLEELGTRLRMTRREAKLVWKYIPPIRATMEWEQKKKKRR